MIKRPCKEVKIKTNPNFDIKYGTFNKNNPKSIYISGKSWVKPIHTDFLESVENMTKQSKSFKFKNDIFSDKSIVNIDITKDRMLLNKKTLLSFEIHLLQNETKELGDEILINGINNVIKNFTNKIEENCEGYLELLKKKK